MRLKMSIKTKLLAAYVLSLIIPIVTIGAFAFYTLQNQMLGKVIQANQNTLDKIVSDTTKYFLSAIEYSNMVANDSRMYQGLSKSSFSGYDMVHFDNEIVNLYSSIIASFFSDPCYLTIFKTDSNIVFSSWIRNNQSLQEWRNSDWFNELQNSTLEHYKWLGLQKSCMPDAKTYVISIARIIKNPYTGKNVGIIHVAIPQESISRGLENEIIYGGTNRYIIDKNNTILASKDESLVGQTLSPEYITTPGSSKKTIGNTLYLINNAPLKISDLTLIETIPFNEMTKDFSGSLVRLLLIIFGMIAMFGIFLLLILKNVFFRIGLVTNAAKQVQQGNLQINIVDDNQDEISMLSMTFNKMVSEINRLLKQIIDVQNAEKEAQIKMLQSQINPHFLFNSLNSIKMLAEMSRALNVSKMVTSLGNILSYSMKNDGNFVSLRDEIKNISDYISLQKIRFMDKFDADIIVPEKMLDIKIIKFLFQPIVENCIVHGFSSLQHKGIIRIKIFIIGQNLYIFISDNGMGITKQSLRSLEHISQKANSIGIANVMKRISLVYGEKAKVRFRPMFGTTVLIKLPVEFLPDVPSVQ